MNIKAKVNISHIDSTEHHDHYEDGQLELVERPDGTYLVQVILGGWCAAAIVDKATFDEALTEDENYPCVKCGRTDLPLFFNRMCPDCYDPELAV